MIAGLTPRRLRQLDRAGEGPKRNSKGLYPVEEFAIWLYARIKKDLGVADGVAYDLRTERARLANAQSEQKELEVAALRSDLVRVSVIEREVAVIVASLKQNVMAMPTRLAAMLEGMTTDERKASIERSCREVLEEFAAYRCGNTISRSRGRR